MNRRKNSIFFLVLLLASYLSLFLSFNVYNNLNNPQINLTNFNFENDEIKTSVGESGNVIVFFNKPTYNQTVKDNFTNYGGIIRKEWNNTLSSISGFAGYLPIENISLFQNNWKNIIVENDEIIETQMNYASLQAGNLNKELQPSNPTRIKTNYDDENRENSIPIYTNSSNLYQSLSVIFDLSSKKYFISTGVKYKYLSEGTGPYDVNITFWGSDIFGGSKLYSVRMMDKNVPYQPGPVWRIVYNTGPNYLIGNNPIVQFNSTNNKTNNLLICADTPSIGNSLFDINKSGNTIDTNYEYIVDLMYENILDLPEYYTIISNITGNDYIDAYFVYLVKDYNYNFILDKISGTGNLNMRLTKFNATTDTILKTTNGSSYPEIMNYKATATGIYILLIEPNTPLADQAVYSLSYKLANGPINSSIAVLDTGVNPNHKYFPFGFDDNNLKGNIVGWKDLISSGPIRDDQGHGTYISSIIAGTGSEPFNSLNPTVLNIRGNYSHTDLFGNKIASGTYSYKLGSFNVSTNSNIFINSSWNLKEGTVNNFRFELYNGTDLVNFTDNQIQNKYYTFNHSTVKSGNGVYDLFIKYTKVGVKIPIFSFNVSILIFPESYNKENFFTGIHNGSKIVSYKILNQSGIGFTSDLITALIDVIQNRSKYHIISICLSIGTIGDELAMLNAVIDEVIKNGILVVIAAGNSGVEEDSLNKLALNKNAIVVGAINDKDQITSYSSVGKDIGNGIIKPDIVAPGGSTLPGHRTIISADAQSNETTCAYGTSIATAIVTAAINVLVEKTFGNWSEWNNLNLTKWVKIIKSALLMTASETTQTREDDPNTTDLDESQYSPSTYIGTQNTLKDENEGYGKLNIYAAIEALNNWLSINFAEKGHLSSSKENVFGTHVFARRLKLKANTQYVFNLTQLNVTADLDFFIFSNESNDYGEPILIDSSQKWYGDFNYLYFTPLKNQTEVILVIKAITGSSDFKLKITEIVNTETPVLKIPEITYASGTKNTTVMSYQEYIGNQPAANYTIDRYIFFIDYYDNDTIPVPPQQIYVSIPTLGKNYTLSKMNPLDNNYTDGVLYSSNQIKLPVAGTYEYFFVASDGLNRVVFPKTKNFTINVIFPTDSEPFPYEHSFEDGIPSSWKLTGTGWDLMMNLHANDDRSRIYQPYDFTWQTLYFGKYHDSYISGLMDYTYQPATFAEDYPNGSITTPLFNLTGINKNTHPFAKFGLRSSINSLDFIYLQINLNWSGWTTIKTYTNEEKEWFLEEINLTQYIGNFIQFRFDTAINAIFDPIKNRGFMLDYFSIYNYSNNNSPIIYTSPSVDVVNPDEGSKLEQFMFSCEYYDFDNNYPKYVYLEMDGTQYQMYNRYGDWNANVSANPGDRGIIFSKSLVIGDIQNRSFRFIASDGKTEVKTQWLNKDNDLIQFVNPEPLEFNIYKDGKLIGYEFPNDDLEDYYIAGTPTPEESTAWLAGDNTWHPINLGGQDLLYGGIGTISYGAGNSGYGQNWRAKLITRPLLLGDEYNVYLQYDFNISLQPEYTPFYFGSDPDKCVVLISNNYGNSWSTLVTYYPDSPNLQGHANIDLSSYEGDVVMIQFRLYSNDQTTLFGFGWFLYNIYVGYDQDTDFLPPTVEILSPEDNSIVNSTITIKARIEDDTSLDVSRIQIYINKESISKDDFEFDQKKGIVKFKWDTNEYEDDIYEITIVAFDEEGNRAEASIDLVVDNGIIDWIKWAPWIIFILIAIIVGILLFIISEKKGKAVFAKIRDAHAEKIRLKEIDKDQAIKRIQLITPEEELARPHTLYCKHCKSWFYSDKFDIICPICDYDQIYVAYNCLNCHRWYFKDEPKEDYYCEKCDGVRLIRREKEEIESLLIEEGKILRKFESSKKKEKMYSILD
ncbi:MAG: S8 family serine peptidase [Promethearchaeota archaeon]